MERQPLVSVCVITYNSSKYILETLESIKAQTYKNIELVISDDCSIDETVAICNKWLNNNRNYFNNIKLIKSSLNTGIAPNANRSANAVSGQWIKFIAGDDKLLPNCIEDNVNYIAVNLDSDIVFSKVKIIGDINDWKWCNCKVYFDNLSRTEFMINLYHGNFLPASSAFIRKTCFADLNGYDETMPFIEDWPFWIKAIHNGYNLSFNDNYTVEYRFSDTSISHGKSSFSYKFQDNIKKAECLALEYLKDINIFSRFFSITWYWHWNEDCSFFKKNLYYLNILNPFYYYYKYAINKFRRLYCQNSSE